MFNKRRVIRLFDLMFESKYFHSATLQVRTPPGGSQFDLFLIITLFTHNGMKEYGVKNDSLRDTVFQFDDLLAQLGRGRMLPTAIDSLCQAKELELKYYRKLA